MKHARVLERAVAVSCVTAVLGSSGLSAAASASTAPNVPAIPMSFAGMSLAQAQDAGIAASPEVAAARARVSGARAALAATRWGAAPSGFASFSESPQGGVGPVSIAAHQTTVGVQATITDVLFGYGPLVGQASAALRSADADEAAAERSERIAAARAYYGALSAIAVLAAREDALVLAQSELHAALIRFGSGDAPHIDVVRANVALARAQADAENARAQEANAREALRVETGADETALASTAGGAPPSVPRLALDPAGAAAAALAFRPEVASAASALDAATQVLRSSRVGLIPPVTVATGYATGVDAGQRVAGRSVTAQMTVPLPFGSAARIDQASSAVAEAQAHLDAVRRDVALSTAAAARSLVGADRAAAATARARAAAREELDAVELGYRAGASSSLDVALARSTYVQAEVDDLSAVYDEAVAAAIFDVEAGR